MPKKYYTVWTGRETGIFNSWANVQKHVSGFKGAQYRSFSTREAAEYAFVNEKPKAPVKASAFTLDNSYDIHIYTDGACDPNPGEAGSGVVVYRAGELSEMYYGLYEEKGTNSKAELKALHEAMLMAKQKLEEGLSVQILTDSEYGLKSMTEWAVGWKARDWTKKKGAISNLSIIKPMYELYCTISDAVSLVHVKAHSGTEGNELADRMAALAAKEAIVELKAYERMGSVEELLAMKSG